MWNLKPRKNAFHARQGFEMSQSKFRSKQHNARESSKNTAKFVSPWDFRSGGEAAASVLRRTGTALSAQTLSSAQQHAFLPRSESETENTGNISPVSGVAPAVLPMASTTRTRQRRIETSRMRSSYESMCGLDRPMQRAASLAEVSLELPNWRERAKAMEKDALVSEYKKRFVEFPPERRPQSLPCGRSSSQANDASKQQLQQEKRSEKLRQDLERMLEKQARVRAGQQTAVGFEIRVPLRPIPSEVHLNFVGGQPPNQWKSDYRHNMPAEVHSKVANARYAQPAGPCNAVAKSLGTPV
eukprot:TRINITY_DN33657_c0_g1_i1.p1 TRINITY_DN33657_c0_g1~~TRINITY_DN33657_c0_g1_i1.p1  ORF type:complete len:299 (+),score=35.27 TRINITY_DN33657_c0_g1_i1:51-947(+)